MKFGLHNFPKSDNPLLNSSVPIKLGDDDDDTRG